MGILGILLLTIAFVSTKFGPWVGLIVPFVGSVVPDLFLFHNPLTPTLQFSLLGALGGFVAGLAFLSTRGNYRSWKAIGLANLASFLGIGVVCIGDFIIESGASFTLILVSGLISLVLLPVAHLLANRFGKPVDQQAKQ